jgi:hypothetical protein
MKPDRDSIHRRAIRLGAAAFLIGLGARIDTFASTDPWGTFGVPGFVASLVLAALSLLLLGLVLRASRCR